MEDKFRSSNIHPEEVPQVYNRKHKNKQRNNKYLRTENRPKSSNWKGPQSAEQAEWKIKTHPGELSKYYGKDIKISRKGTKNDWQRN